MIAPIDSSALSLLLNAPQFERSGPFRPGMDVPVVLPLHNLRDDDESDIEVTFHGEAVSFATPQLTVGHIAARSSIDVRTNATVLPLNGKRDIAVWAEVRSRSGTVMKTAVANAPIFARPELALAAFENEGETRLSICNKGDAPTTVCLSVFSDFPLPAHARLRDQPIALSGHANIYQSPEIELGAGEEVPLVIAATGIKQVTITDHAGNRTAARPQVVRSLTPVLEPVTLNVTSAKEGVRQGDVLPFSFALRNGGHVVVEEVTAELHIPEHFRLLHETITVDDVRLVPARRTINGQTALLELGRVSLGAQVIVRGTLVVDRNDHSQFESVDITGALRAKQLDELALHAEIYFDHRPAFAQSTTYLGDFVHLPDGGYEISAVVTNAEDHPIERVRIRWDLLNLLPTRSPRRANGESIDLQPTSLDGRPALVTNLGTLAAHASETVTIALRPIVQQTNERDANAGGLAERELAVRAILLAGDGAIPLGESREQLAGQARLGQSAIVVTDERPLRIGVPVDGILDLRNEGDAPAYDVRIRLDMPPYVEATLPQAGNAAGWRTMCAVLPVGVQIKTPITFLLTGPPSQTTTTIRVQMDADGCAPMELPAIELHTPTRAVIDPPIVRAEPIDDGYIAISARIANNGDGIARNVVAHLPQDPADLPALPRSTSVDGMPVDDRGARSPLMAGLVLGELLPGAFRDISWIVAPNDELAYRARLRVSYDEGEVTIGTSAPRRPRLDSAFRKALPVARMLDNSVPAGYGAREATISLIEHGPRGLASDLSNQPPAAALPPDLYDRTLFVGDLGTAALAGESERPALGAGEDLRLDIPQPSAAPELAVGEASTPGPPTSASTSSEPATDEQPNPVEAVQHEASPEGLADDPPQSAYIKEEPSPDSDRSVMDAALDLPEESPAVLQLTEVQVEEAAHDGPPSIHFASTLGDPHVRRTLRLAQQLLAVEGIGWWRHVLMLRSFLAASVPGDEAAQHAYADLREAVENGVMEAYPKILVPSFALSPAWVASLHECDELAFDALKRYAEGSSMIPVPASATAAELDAALTGLLPKTLGETSVDAELEPYVKRLIGVFANPEIRALDDAARYTRFGKMPNSTLDELLSNLWACVAKTMTR